MGNVLKKCISIPKDLGREVKDYQHKNQIASFSATIAILLVKGLKSEER